METIMNEQRFDRNHTWMIGNSIKTDVLPALHAGIHSIHIPVQQDWDTTKGRSTSLPKGAFYQLNSLQEVPETIHGVYSKIRKGRFQRFSSNLGVVLFWYPFSLYTTR